MKNLKFYLKNFPLFTIGITWLAITAFLHLFLGQFVEVEFTNFIGIYAGAFGFFLAGTVQVLKHRKNPENVQKEESQG